MSAPYKQRAVSFEDIARQYLRAKSATLEEQLETSLFVEKIKREMSRQTTDAADGVIDFKRGWRLK